MMRTRQQVFAGIVSLLMLGTVQPAVSAPISDSRAAVAAAGWLARSAAAGGGSGYRVAGATPIRDAGETVAYVFQLAPSGFLVMAADDRLPPVLAYSLAGQPAFQDAEGSSALTLLKVDLAARRQRLLEAATAAARASASSFVGVEAAIAAAQRQWAQLGAGDAARSAREFDINVGPLLTTRWSQEYDMSSRQYVDKQPTFNYYTPEVTRSGETFRAPTGCIATAVSQLMNYYQWPPYGEGEHSYQWSGQTLSASFSQRYGWADMLDSYYRSFGDPLTSTEAQREAVGRLMYDCGVALEANYGYGQTDAYLSDVPGVLRGFFRYAGADFRSTYDTAARQDVIASLQHGVPVLLSIRSLSHVVVGDGLRREIGAEEYCHLNFGWHGACNGWYVFDGTFWASGGEGQAGAEYPDSHYCGGFDEAMLGTVPGLLLNDLGGNGYGAFELSWQHAVRPAAEAFEVQERSTLDAGREAAALGETAGPAWTVQGNWQALSTPEHQSVWWGRPDENVIGRTETLSLVYAIRPGANAQLSYQYATANFWGQGRRIDVSVDDGATWQELLHSDGPVTWNPVSPDFGPLQWQPEQVSLAGLAADPVHDLILLRFSVVRLDGTGLINYHKGGNIDYCGWYLDDLTVSDGELYGWETVTDTLTDSQLPLTGRALGSYWYRVRPRYFGQWFAWSNPISYDVVENPTRTLSVTAAVGGNTDPAPGQHTYPLGAVAPVSAQPDEHYEFAGWVLDGEPVSGNPVDIPMDANRELTATFSLRRYTLTVESPYGTADPAIGAHDFLYGTAVTASCAGSPVALESGRQAVLSGWSLGPPQGSGAGGIAGPFNIGGDMTLRWQWQTQSLIAVSVVGPGAVAVVGAAGVPWPTSGWVPDGTGLTVSAAASDGAVFDAWEGALTAGAVAGRPVFHTRLGEPLTVTAHFEAFVDQDGDGLHDPWELRYWPSVDAPDATPGANPDGDAFDNDAEFANRTDPTAFTLSAPQGWSLISVPVTAPDGVTVEQQLAQLVGWQIWRWDGRRYHAIVPGAAGRQDQVLTPGSGYWLFAPRAALVDLPGTQWGDVNVAVSPGWWLLGPVHGGDISAGELAPASRIVEWREGRFQGCGNRVKSGSGYWVYCPSAGAMALP